MMDKMRRKSNSHSLLVGMPKVILEDRLVISHKTKHSYTIQSRSHTPWYLPKGAGNLSPHKKLHMDVYSSFMHNCQTWKYPKCSSLGEWLNKLWYIESMEYYFVLKRSQLSSHEKTRKNLKCILLGEISQPKSLPERISTVWHSRKGEAMETVQVIVISRGWEWEVMSR